MNSVIKRTAALLLLALLGACGGNSGVADPEYGVSVVGLSYLQKATFNVTGTSVEKVGKVTIKKCAGLALDSSSTSTQKVITCSINGSGDLLVELKSADDAVLYSTTFTVPEPRVKLTTTLGAIVVELNPTAAPLSTANFMTYVNAGFYTNTLLHRVISNFVVQGGLLTTAPAVQTGLRAPITLESNNGLSNVRGSIGMARTPEPNSATSQFFFNVIDNPGLNYVSSTQPGYAVFGKVVQGLEVVDAIAAVPTGSRYGLNDVPLTDIVVIKAEQIQ